jgi:hypothetical protein
LPANTLPNALLFHGLTPADEASNRLKLAAVDLFLRGGERDPMVAALLQLGEDQFPRSVRVVYRWCGLLTRARLR